MPFEYTSQMWAWFEATVLDGPVCVTDKWTYGRCLAMPNKDGKPGYSFWSTSLTRDYLGEK